jgi:hypothetical protein
MNQIALMKQAVMLLRDGPDNNVHEAVDLLCQAIEQAGKVEPISSILTKWKTGMICGQDAMVLLFRHYSSDPATPKAPAQPLTVDQVHKGLYNDFKESSKNMRDAYFAGVCFAEKYHGITGASL